MTDKQESYNQKYLDDKFQGILTTLISLESLVRTNTEVQTKAYQNILNRINSLSTSDVIMEKDIKDLKHQIEGLQKNVARNNFFSVKGVIFVVAIFATVMIAFLVNGVDLLTEAL